MSLLVAIILAILPVHPNLWVCNPGKSPVSAPTNCEHLRVIILEPFKW